MHTAYQLRDAHMIFGVLTGLSSFARLFGWLIGKDLSPLTVKVCYGPVLDEQLVAWLLPGRVEFEAEDNLLCFPARYLALPLVRGAAELEVKYEGYVRHQEEQVGRARALEALRIPPEFDWPAAPGLSSEAREVWIRRAICSRACSARPTGKPTTSAPSPAPTRSSSRDSTGIRTT